ncbi:MAG TPA: archease [Terriglobia bacterium]|nr:archease [Terriglobia bacterium]
MDDFRVLEHTADVGFEALGVTREDVFRNAGRALMNVIVDLDSVAPRQAVPVAAEGHEPGALLVDWLSEILYLQDTEGWLFRDFEVTGLTDRTVTASGFGERFDPGRHRIKLLVKAITYHQLALEKTGEGHWRAQVYVDI